MATRLVTILLVGLLALAAAAQEASAPKTQKQKISYALGMDLGNQLRTIEVQVDPEVFAKGLADAMAGGKAELTQDEVRAAIAELQAEMKRFQLEARRKGAHDGKQEGEAFLVENGKKEGVVTLPSGLQYKIVRAGTGKKPNAEDTVIADYRATFIDGSEFDSSYRRNQPGVFPLKAVIKGMSEALRLMPAGSKWQVFIPPQLAYGDHGMSGQIGPNTTLIYELEVLNVREAPQKEAQSGGATAK